MGTQHITLEQINALNSTNITPLIAYAVGLCFFQLKVCEMDDQKYLVGGINHNSDSVTKKEIFEHYNALRLFMEHDDKYCFKILANHKKTNKISTQNEEKIGRKLGFALLINFDNKTGSDDYSYVKELLLSISNSLLSNNLLERKYFFGGLFDGRSSDDNKGKITVDYDEYYVKEDFKNIKQNLSLLDSVKIDVNERDGTKTKKTETETVNKSKSKSKQFRIKKDGLIELINNDYVILFSTKRKSQICG